MIAQANFTIGNPVRTLHGEDSIRQLPFLLDELGMHNPLYLISRSASTAGVTDLLALRSDVAGNQVIVSSREISVDTVDRIVHAFHVGSFDGIIALGGGSIIDLAKIVKLLSAYPSDTRLSDLEGWALQHTRTTSPLIIIPTTIGTGSGATRVAYLKRFDGTRMLRLDDPALHGDVTIVDPKMSKAASSLQTAMGIASILGRAFESLISMGANVAVEQFAVQSLSLVITHAYRVVHTPHDLESRAAVSTASQLAGIAFSQTGGSIAHALSIAMANGSEIPYGLAMWILLPHCLRFELQGGSASATRMEALLGSSLEPESGLEGIDSASWIARFLQGLTTGLSPTMPNRLYEVYDPRVQKRLLAPHQLEEVALAALDSFDMLTSRTKPNLRDLIRILEAAYWGYPSDNGTTEKPLR